MASCEQGSFCVCLCLMYLSGKSQRAVVYCCYCVVAATIREHPKTHVEVDADTEGPFRAENVKGRQKMQYFLFRSTPHRKRSHSTFHIPLSSSVTMTKTEAQPSASNGAAMPSSPPPPSSLQARDLPSAVNSKELLDAHVARTGGKVVYA